MEQKKAVKVKTPRFRVSFAQLFAAKSFQDTGTPKYSVTAIFDQGTNLKDLLVAAHRVGKEKFGDKWLSDGGKWPKGFRCPFRDAGEMADAEGYGKGKIFVRLTANVDYPPAIFNKDLTPIDMAQKHLMYSGCYAVATIRPYAYEMRGNKGVAFGLLGIQKVAEGERLGGAGTSASDFTPVEDESDNPDNYESDDTSFENAMM